MKMTLVDVLAVASVVCGLSIVAVPLMSAQATEAGRSKALDRLRQISASFLLYAEGSDGVLPRGDGCLPNSSLNPLHHRPELNDQRWEGCLGPFYNRRNHYTWQKWIADFVDKPSAFENPMRSLDPVVFERDGTLLNGFTLNVALMGTVKVDLERGTEDRREWRRSWIDGRPANLMEPERTMLVMDVATFLPFTPMLRRAEAPNDREPIVYPLAVREYWTYLVRAGTLADCLSQTKPPPPDPRKTVGAMINLATLDGGARALTVDEFLAATPTKAQWGIRAGGPSLGWQAGHDCDGLQPNPLTDFLAPRLNTKIDAPLWGLRR